MKMHVPMLAAALLAASFGPAVSACGSVHRSEYLASEAERREVRKAAVLPLENLTATPDAGRVVAEEISAELTRARIDVVDRASAESAFAKLELTPGGAVDRLAARRLGEILGVDAVVIGTVAEATDGAARPGPSRPTIGLSVRVVDVKSGNYLLAGTYTAAGGSNNAAAAKAAGEIAKAVRP